MNHFFKTILNKATGLIYVVSEKTKSCHASCSAKTGHVVDAQDNISVPKSFKKTLLTSLTSVVLYSFIPTIGFAQGVYDGTDSGIQLDTAGNFGWNLDKFVGDPDLSGVILKDENGAAIQSDSDIVIDYSMGKTPDFVVAGYGGFLGGQDKEQKVQNNTLTIKQGNIHGDAYAGLVHITDQLPSSDCSVVGGSCRPVDKVIHESKALISVQNNINIDGNSLDLKNVYSGFASVDLGIGSVVSNAVESKNLIEDFDNTSITKMNNLSLNGDKNKIENLGSGYIENKIQLGDLKIVDGALSNLQFDKSYVFSHQSLDMSMRNNVFSAESNIVAVNGNKNILQDVLSGTVLNQMNIGHVEVGDVYNVAPVTTSIYNDKRGDANFYLSSSSYILNTNNVLTAESNVVEVNGNDNKFNHLSSGQVQNRIKIAGKNISNVKTVSDVSSSVANGGKSAYSNVAAYNSAYAHIDNSNNTFNSELNSTHITGDNNSFKDVLNGQLINHVEVGDLKVGDAEGKATVKNVNAGLALTDANLTVSSNVSAALDAFGSSLKAQSNSISIQGNNNKFGNIFNGAIDNQIYIGNLDAGHALAQATTETSASRIPGLDLKSSANTDVRVNAKVDGDIIIRAEDNEFTSSLNAIELNGNNNTLADIYGGHITHQLKVGHLSTGDASASSEIILDAEVENSQLALQATTSALIEMNVSENLLSAESNKIVIHGDNNQLTNLTAGYIDLNIEVGNVKAGKAFVNGVEVEGQGQATLLIDASNTQLLANKNSIDLNGSSTISGDIYGAYTQFNIAHGTVTHGDGHQAQAEVKLDGTSVMATDNIVSINGRHHFNNAESKIYGAYLALDGLYQPESYDVFSGNTLNYANRTPITIKEIGNFQTYNFTLSPELGNTGTALIKADTVILGANKNNISDGSTTASDVYVTGIHSGKLVATGTEFILMKAQNLDGEGVGYHSTDVVQQGISLLYDVETKVDKANNQVTATIISGHDEPDPKINPQLKSLLEGNLASLMLLTRSADHLAYNTFSAITEQNRKAGFVPFVQMSGHHARYNSGSHIDADGGLMTAGISFQNDHLTLAVFSENGWDRYDSHNTFSDAAKVDASGNNRFNGGGLLGQYNFDHGLYLDASFRAGRLHSHYKTEDIRNSVTDEAAAYKIDSRYLGAHAGVGYQFQINPLNSYDLNLKYLWANTEAQDVMIAGDEIHFDQLNSHRLRLNGENSYQFNPSWSLLLGTGLEYEFEGEAEGTTYQRFRIDVPSVKGFTALGSLGVRYQPISNKNLTIDFKGHGYLGERDGGGATLHMQYAF